jgi:hypothetical protein
LSDTFPIQNGLKQVDISSPQLFSFAVDYAIRKVREYQVKLKGTHQFLFYADDVIDTIKEGDLEVNTK